MHDRKIALPLKNKQLSSHLEKCSEFIIFTVKEGKCLKKDFKKAYTKSGTFPQSLVKNGITDVITKGINIQTAVQFNKFKIHVFAGVEISDPEQLVDNFLNGSLETNSI